MCIRNIFSLALSPVALLLVPGLMIGVPPQDPSNKPSTKETLTLTGTVSEKGALLLAAVDQKIYRVLNSETLKHLEGQVVTLKARFLPEKGQLYVTAVRGEAPAPSTSTFRPDDAAFRR